MENQIVGRLSTKDGTDADTVVVNVSIDEGEVFFTSDNNPNLYLVVNKEQLKDVLINNK